MKCVVEEGDPIVLTDTSGNIVSGPHPAPPTSVLVINYSGPRVRDDCWGVLNPDGTLAFQSTILVTTLYGDERITLTLDKPVDDHLTTDDRKWLNQVNQVQ